MPKDPTLQGHIWKDQSPQRAALGTEWPGQGGLDGAEARGSAEIMWGDQGSKGLRILPARR